MPTYDYTCRYCNEAFEIFHPITQGPLEKCPKCKRKGLKRLIGSGAGLIFKGTGFYETDYKRRSDDGPKESSGALKGKSKDKKCSENTVKKEAKNTEN